jgi:hypothetical protein
MSVFFAQWILRQIFLINAIMMGSPRVEASIILCIYGRSTIIWVFLLNYIVDNWGQMCIMNLLLKEIQMKAYVKGMTAQEVLAIRIKEIEQLADSIKKEAANWKSAGTDWGHVGSASYVVENLEEIAGFLSIDKEAVASSVMIQIVRGSMDKFPYGYLSDDDRIFVAQSVGKYFMGTRVNMNIYELQNGHLVHVYNATEIVG